ncbi:deoxyribose-phosphate aldolase [Alkalicoccus chagannorensis]|uniref:deoxyribose-phosphate aldolase n=1 Tax=Alkalicoccus chagannorensis TaxID=427072 RepID=UPI00040E9EF1|nr:deoxyribose-phosphate aldolase [Alkalicoccus chagannorensis]
MSQQDMEALVQQITDQVMKQLDGSEEQKESGSTSTPSASVPKQTYTPGYQQKLVTGAEVARLIDHTLLKPESTQEQIETLCDDAAEYRFATVCVQPTWVPLCVDRLKDSSVGVTTVIGFPLGATTTFTKMAETRDVIAAGADEVDMVINIGAMKSGNYDLVKRDIEGVIQAANGQAVTKVIIETGFLTEEEKKKACMLAKMAGADFVKTSTGFGPGCATPEDIKLMRDTVGPDLGVKASACVRDLDTARAVIAAGATRIGASAGKEIVKGKQGEGY